MPNNIYNTSIGGYGRKTLLGIAIVLLVINMQWGFIFQVTVFANLFIAKTLIAGVSFLFLWYFLSQKGTQSIKNNTCWVIYAMLTMLSMLIHIKIINILPWICYFVIMLRASHAELNDIIPFKFIFWSGVFGMFGVYLQFFMPTFYTTYINGLFQEDFLYDKLDTITDIAEIYGMRGFFYNQGNTAIVLIYAFIVLLYFRGQLLTAFSNSKLIFSISAVLLLIAVFFTGKRSLSLIGVMIPLMTWFLTSKKGGVKIMIIVSIIVLISIIYYIVLPYIFEHFNFFFFQRLQESFYNAKTGDSTSLTSGRDYIWNLAIKTWNENPIFGVGAANFIDYTGSRTDVHNSYLQILCEQGIIGFTFYIIALLSSIVYTIRLLKKDLDTNLRAYLKVSLASQLTYALYSFTGNPHIDFCMTMEILSVAITLRIGYLFSIRKREALNLNHAISYSN